MVRDFYRKQSRVTDPGSMVGWLNDLPRDIPSLRRIARGLVVHYRADDLNALGIPPERVAEVDTRYAEKMLVHLQELAPGPWSRQRPPQSRLVGCCRDFTVLFLTLLRHQGIPARARVGFASYFQPDWYLDHEVAEVWDGTAGRWRLIDAQLADAHLDREDGATLDPLDIPRDRFLVGGEAWRACRGDDADAERFVVDPGLDIPDTRGWPYLRHNLIHDLATLNKEELLLWDEWGLMEGDAPDARELALLDRIAALTQHDDPPLAKVQALYASEPGLKAPPEVTSFSPAIGEPRTVRIAV